MMSVFETGLGIEPPEKGFEKTVNGREVLT